MEKLGKQLLEWEIIRAISDSVGGNCHMGVRLRLQAYYVARASLVITVAVIYRW